MANLAANAPTIGEIVRRTGYPLHRVEYVIRSRHIQSAIRAGNTRIFTEADIQRIESELKQIDAEREVSK